MLNPNNPYAASKAATVLMIRAWKKSFNFPGIITNSINNFGPFQFVEKFIPRSIILGLTMGNIEVYGKGQNIRSWIDVSEHVKALILISKKGKVGETYNISSGFKVNNFTIAKKIKAILKKKNILVKIKFINDRPGHDRNYSINFKKLQKLGYNFNFNFDEKLKETVEWYLDPKNLKNFKNLSEHLIRKGGS